MSPQLTIQPFPSADNEPIARALELADVPATVEVLQALLARHATRRDAEGGCPKAERDALRASGLLALSIPVELGGWAVRGRTRSMWSDGWRRWTVLSRICLPFTT